ncbi:hypothetical protein D9M71_176340 [compost metagenome]
MPAGIARDVALDDVLHVGEADILARAVATDRPPVLGEQRQCPVLPQVGGDEGRSQGVFAGAQHVFFSRRESSGRADAPDQFAVLQLDRLLGRQQADVRHVAYPAAPVEGVVDDLG